MPRRAISIRQPWVEPVLRGIKKNEFRHVPTNTRGRVYIYASLQTGESPRDWGRVGKEPDGDAAAVLVVGRCPRELLMADE